MKRRVIIAIAFMFCLVIGLPLGHAGPPRVGARELSAIDAQVIALATPVFNAMLASLPKHDAGSAYSGLDDAKNYRVIIQDRGPFSVVSFSHNKPDIAGGGLQVSVDRRTMSLEASRLTE